MKKRCDNCKRLLAINDRAVAPYYEMVRRHRIIPHEVILCDTCYEHEHQEYEALGYKETFQIEKNEIA